VRIASTNTTHKMKKNPTKNTRSNNSTKRNTQQNNSDSDNESGKLKELFLHELKDIYWAEKHLVKTLPKLEKAATSSELQQAFADHTTVTQKHVERLEEVFNLLGEKPVAKVCDGMKGLTDEAEEVKSETDKDSLTRDAGLIIAAQKVEHYEIAAYGSLVQIAKTIGFSEVSEILEETLDEEIETDQKLSEIAESNINVEALQE
jgi:ferritin-like metal-binding protein YciE